VGGGKVKVMLLTQEEWDNFLVGFSFSYGYEMMVL